MTTITGTAGNDSLTATADGDVVLGLGGNDTLSDGGFAVTLTGGAGNDTFIVNNIGTVVSSGAGNNTIQSSVTYTLVNNVNTLILTGNVSLTGTGNAGADVLVANNAGDKLIDGGGLDTLVGGVGNDTFVVSNAGDSIISGGGADTVNTALNNYTLAAGVANLTLTGNAALAATGNTGSNIITDNGAVAGDTLSGGGGAGTDTYIVTSANDVINDNGKGLINTNVSYSLLVKAVNAANLTLTGTNALNVTGNALDNVITDSTSLGAGGDTLNGGGAVAGDTYIINNALDVVHGNAGKADLIISSVDFSLATATNVNKLTLAGAAISATGNNSADTLTGNTNNDVISDGTGAAADTMIGNSAGTGDTFIVHNAGDIVTENDVTATAALIKTSVSFTASANINNLTLTAAGIAGTGNALNNTITDSGLGADTLIGGGGTDTYIVTNAGDVVTDNGLGLIKSSVSFNMGANAVAATKLTLTAAGIAGTGNALNNTITDSGLGADTLTGNSGGTGDTFVVSNAGDIVTENDGTATTATILSSVTFTAVAHVNNLTLTAAGIAGTGNALDNVITDSGLGANTLIGGTGNDTYVVRNAGDIVSENAGEGTDLVLSSVSYGLTANVENLTLTAGGKVGTGNAGNNIITSSNAGNDTLVGNGGTDTYIINNFTDEVIGNAGGGDTVETNVDYSLVNVTNINNLTLLGNGNIDGYGNTANNIIQGNAGDNLLVDGGGADTLIGGAGNDTYEVGNAGDLVSENPGGGTDLVLTSINYTLPANVENLAAVAGNLTLTGNALNNIISDAGGGAGDKLIGGGGTDTYVVSNAQDVIIANVAGNDLIQSSVSYSLADVSNVNRLTLLLGGLTGIGNAANNIITASAAGDVLDGGLGADTLNGGAGNDTFVVDNIGDVVTSGGGSDTLQTSVSYSVQAVPGISLLHLTGTASIVVTGNAAGDIFYDSTAPAGHNTLIGSGGANDIFDITSNDTVIESNPGARVNVTLVGGATTYAMPNNVSTLRITGGSASHTINGSSGDDFLLGNGLNNVINGGAGQDTMVGGFGNDTYYVDNVNDACSEIVGQGTDLIYTSSDYNMLMNAPNVENLIMTGRTGLNVIGNNWDQRIVGTPGNDTIHAGPGFDTLIGGYGNDTYILDNPKSPGTPGADVIVDFGGIDTVEFDSVPAGVTSFAYTLQAGLENLKTDLINPSVNVTLTGNAYSNVITGDGGNDSLSGLAGNDTIIDGNGNDTITDGNGNDVISVGNGNNTITVGNGRDTIIVGNGNDTITVGNGNDHFTLGGTGTHIVHTGFGADTISNGSLLDTYYINNARDVLTGSNPDTLFVSVSYVMDPAVPVNKVTLTKSVYFTSSDSNQTITGAAAGDVIHLGMGNDTVHNSGGHDLIYCGAGDDDIVLDAGSLKTVTDIYGFVPKPDPVTPGDVLDISAIISGWQPGNAISPFVHITDYRGSSYVSVDRTGDGIASHYVHVATIHGVTGLTGEYALIIDGTVVPV